MKSRSVLPSPNLKTRDSMTSSYELTHRQHIWKHLLARGGPDNVAPGLLRELGYMEAHREFGSMLSAPGALQLPMASQWACCIQVAVTLMILTTVACCITIRVPNGLEGETNPRWKQQRLLGLRVCLYSSSRTLCALGYVTFAWLGSRIGTMRGDYSSYSLGRMHRQPFQRSR